MGGVNNRLYVNVLVRSSKDSNFCLIDDLIEDNLDYYTENTLPSNFN